MTVPFCPKCQGLLPAADINVAKDLAYCRACNLAHALSGLVAEQELVSAPCDLQRPPAGTWYDQGPVDTVIGASHRSWPAALGALAVCLFWNGIVSVFVLIALSDSLHKLGIEAPAWFPAPKMNDRTMDWGAVVFLWLFLTPFIAIGSGMLLYLLSAVAGRTEVRLCQNQGTIFVGIGPLGWKRRFSTALVHTVTLREKIRQGKNGNTAQQEVHLELQDGETLEFGSMIPEERQHFFVSALRRALCG